jgi:hypothetical protein
MEKIFYLKLSSDTQLIESNFIRMADCLNQELISLIPVRFSQLIQYSKGPEKIKVICLCSNFTENSNFLKIYKRYLDFAIRQKKLTLFHVTSFESLKKFESLSTNYLHFRLPIQIDDLAKKIGKHIIRHANKENIFSPGKNIRISF